MPAVAAVRGEQRASASNRLHQIVWDSPALRTVLEQVQLVGPTDSTVLILGETGTGKELIAGAIHSISRHSRRPFVKLN